MINITVFLTLIVACSTKSLCPSVCAFVPLLTRECFTAFEAYWGDSWQNVERLSIKDGSIRMHVIDDDSVIEVQIPISNVRIRPRKATAIDCTCLLRPGIDVSVLSIPQRTEEEDTEDTGDSPTEDLKPVSPF